MRIKVTRSEAITALQQGKCIWFGAENEPELACGYELGPRSRASRRKCASGLTGSAGSIRRAPNGLGGLSINP